MFVAVVSMEIGEKPASTNKSFAGLPLLLATVTWAMCLMGWKRETSTGIYKNLPGKLIVDGLV